MLYNIWNIWYNILYILYILRRYSKNNGIRQNIIGKSNVKLKERDKAAPQLISRASIQGKDFFSVAHGDAQRPSNGLHSSPNDCREPRLIHLQDAFPHQHVLASPHLCDEPLVTVRSLLREEPFLRVKGAEQRGPTQKSKRLRGWGGGHLELRMENIQWEPDGRNCFSWGKKGNGGMRDGCWEENRKACVVTQERADVGFDQNGGIEVGPAKAEWKRILWAGRKDKTHGGGAASNIGASMPLVVLSFYHQRKVPSTMISFVSSQAPVLESHCCVFWSMATLSLLGHWAYRLPPDDSHWAPVPSTT